MCLAKRARVLNQKGLEYTADNMEALMLRRYENKKLLRAGKHPKGSPKRTKEQDVKFADAVLINGMIIADNIHSALFSVAAYTVILCFSLFKTGSLAKSIFHAH